MESGGWRVEGGSVVWLRRWGGSGEWEVWCGGDGGEDVESGEGKWGEVWRGEVTRGESMVWYVRWSHVLKGAVMQYCHPHTALCNSCYQSPWVVTNLRLSLFVN